MRARPRNPDTVIPAKAGIQLAFASCTNIKMDDQRYALLESTSSFRWDDGIDDIDGCAVMSEPLRGCTA